MMAEASTQAGATDPGLDAQVQVAGPASNSASPSMANAPERGEEATDERTQSMSRDDSRMLEALNEINQKQSDILDLLRVRARPEQGVSVIAEQLWDSIVRTWTDPDLQKDISGKEFVGMRFLKSLVPSGHALLHSVGSDPEYKKMDPIFRARKMFKRWIMNHGMQFKEDIISRNQSDNLANIDSWWPRTGNVTAMRSGRAANATWKSFENPCIFLKTDLRDPVSSFGQLYVFEKREKLMYSAFLAIVYRHGGWSRYTARLGRHGVSTLNLRCDDFVAC
jgi:hypothetical protein